MQVHNIIIILCIYVYIYTLLKYYDFILVKFIGIYINKLRLFKIHLAHLLLDTRSKERYQNYIHNIITIVIPF